MNQASSQPNKTTDPAQSITATTATSTAMALGGSGSGSSAAAKIPAPAAKTKISSSCAECSLKIPSATDKIPASATSHSDTTRERDAVTNTAGTNTITKDTATSVSSISDDGTAAPVPKKTCPVVKSSSALTQKPSSSKKHSLSQESESSRNTKRLKKKGYAITDMTCDHRPSSLKPEENGGSCKNGYSLDGVLCESCGVPFIGSKAKENEWHVSACEAKYRKVDGKKIRVRKGKVYHCPNVYECGHALCGCCYEAALKTEESS